MEPLRANITSGDSIPINPVARDARGSIIPDATISVSPTNIALNGIWAGPNSVLTPTLATITPTLSGIALPAANPGAPQVPVLTDESQITILPPQTVVAGATQVSVGVVLPDSLSQPAFNKWLRFGSPYTAAPDSVQADGSGAINTV